MPEKYHNPYVQWKRDHPLETMDPISAQRFINLPTITSILVSNQRRMVGGSANWASDTSVPPPDFVNIVSDYGRVQIMYGDWESYPIEIPVNELAFWKEHAGVVTSIEDIDEWQGGVIAGFFSLIRNHDESVDFLCQQLVGLLDEFEALIDSPLEHWLPTHWTGDEVYEEDARHEQKRLDRVFTLYEILFCFETGLEAMRMIAITEKSDEFNLPDKELYQTLCDIDGLMVARLLEQGTPKLMDIMNMWSNTIMMHTGRPYHRPYNDRAPKQFWWRHPLDKKTRSPR